MSIVLDGTANTVTPLNGALGGTTPSTVVATNVNTPNTFGFKNRIINGDMRIDQRNNGSSVSLVATTQYVLDRWGDGGLTGSTVSVQRVADAPASFKYSNKLTVTTTTTANDWGIVYQSIEASNVLDFKWGESAGEAATLSFWVKANNAGIYNASIKYLGSSATYYYLSPYTLTANTWTYVTVSIPTAPTAAGAFTGADNAAYMVVSPVTIASSGYSTTIAANTWSSTQAYKTTGTFNLASTASATVQITGVQLEKGSTATSFDVRDYGRELAMCQRYFQNFYPQQLPMTRFSASSGSGYAWVFHPEMRTAATVTFGTYSTGSGYPSSGTMLYGAGVTNGFRIYSSDNITANTTIYFVATSNTTLSAEL